MVASPPPSATDPTVRPNEPGWAKCSWCNTWYHLGEAAFRLGANNEYGYYPEGERRYWQHTLTTRHQTAIDQVAIATAAILAHLPKALKNGKAWQKMMEDPLFKMLRYYLE